MECELRFAGLRHRGVVVDASPRGLFVRTQAKPTSAGEVEIRLRLPGRSHATRLRAAPVRLRLGPAAAPGAAAGGVGLRVVDAPESYAAFFQAEASFERSPDRRAPVLRVPPRARRAASRIPQDGSRFESRPAPAPTLVLDEEIRAEAADVAEALPALPLLRMPARPRCGICRRDDRPVWGGVCPWCHGHDRG
jgi:hypothetical protein